MSAKKSRSNKKQINMLVDFMSTYDHVATGEFTGPLGAKRADSQWQKIRDILKEHGPDRTVEQWKQTWKDLKKGARTENAAAARARCATGNAATRTVPTVSEVSTKVLNVIVHESSIGIGPDESIIGQANEIIEVSVVEHEPSDQSSPSLLYPILPVPTSFTDELENIHSPCTSNPAPSTHHPAPSTSHQDPSSHPTLSTQNIKKKIVRLQEENNANLQSIEARLKERNNLLREQNKLLREQNAHLAHRNKLKRLKRFSLRF